VKFARGVREGVLEGLAELQGETELQTIVEGMTPALSDVFRPGDAVLLALGTAGLSPSTTAAASGTGVSEGTEAGAGGPVSAALELLTAAVEAAAEPDLKRPFELFVPEGGPGAYGRALAVRLSTAPGAGAGTAERRAIPTTFVADATVGTLMQRLTKVLVPCFAVAANGDVIVPAGVCLTALAAHAAGRPVIVVTTALHLCPEASGQALGFPGNAIVVGAQAAGEVLSFGTTAGAVVGAGAGVDTALLFATGSAGSGASEDGGHSTGGSLTVHTPLREMLPARFISGYLLDTGVTTAAGVAQLVRENYGQAL
jgi:translation initiation factor 2B subunit (eIF-2B alpha/beta/delta family)